MWYAAQTTCGKERTAIEECRNALPENLAARIFVPRYQYMKKYQGQWHTEEAAAFPGYVFIESEKPAELEEALLRIPHTVTPVCIGGGFYPIRKEEEIFLRQMLDEQDCIRCSIGYLVDGQLMVWQGPLKHAVERVRKIDRHKRLAEVEVRLFEESRQMKLGLEVKAKVSGEEYERMLETA